MRVFHSHSPVIPNQSGQRPLQSRPMRTMSERSRRSSSWQSLLNRGKPSPVDPTSLRGYCYADQPARKQPLIIDHVFESPRQPPQVSLRRPSGLQWSLLRDRIAGSRPAIPTQVEVESPTLRSRLLLRPLHRSKTVSGNRQIPIISAPVIQDLREQLSQPQLYEICEEIDEDEIKSHRGPSEAIFTLRQHPNPQAEISVAYSYPPRSTSLAARPNHAALGDLSGRPSASNRAASNVTAPHTSSTLRNLAEVDPDKDDKAFARIHPAGWNQILPKQWIEDSPDHSESANTGTTQSLYSHDEPDAQDVEGPASSIATDVRLRPTQSAPRSSPTQYVSRLGKTVNPRFQFEDDKEQDLDPCRTRPYSQPIYTEVGRAPTQPQSQSESQIAQSNESWWDDDVEPLAVNTWPSHDHFTCSPSPKVAQTSISADEMYEQRLEQPQQPGNAVKRPNSSFAPVPMESPLAGSLCDASSATGPALSPPRSSRLRKPVAVETSQRAGEREAVDEWFHINERAELFAMPIFDHPVQRVAPTQYQTTVPPIQAASLPFVIRRRPVAATGRTVMVPGRIYRKISQLRQDRQYWPLFVPQRTSQPVVKTATSNPTPVQLENPRIVATTSENVDQQHDYNPHQQYGTGSPRELDDRYFESQTPTQSISGHIDHLIDMYLPEIPEEGSGDGQQKAQPNAPGDAARFAGGLYKSEDSSPRAADKKSPQGRDVAREGGNRTYDLHGRPSRMTTQHTNTTDELEHCQSRLYDGGVPFRNTIAPTSLRRQAPFLGDHPISPGGGRSSGHGRGAQVTVAPTTYFDEHGNTWI